MGEWGNRGMGYWVLGIGDDEEAEGMEEADEAEEEGMTD